MEQPRLSFTAGSGAGVPALETQQARRTLPLGMPASSWRQANLCSCSYVHTAGALTAPSRKNLNSHQVDDSAIGYSQAEPTEPGERCSYLTPRMTSRQMLNNISHEQKSDAIYKQLKSSHPRRANSQGKGHLVGFWSDSRAVFVSCIRLTRLGPVCDNPVSGSLLGIFSCSHLCRSIQSLKSMV